MGEAHPEFKYLHDTVHALNQSVNSIAVNNQAQTSLQERNAETLEKLSHEVIGNGKPGLLVRVGDLERESAAAKEAARAVLVRGDKRMAFWSRVFWLVVAPILTGAGGLFVLLGIKLFNTLNGIEGHLKP